MISGYASLIWQTRLMSKKLAWAERLARQPLVELKQTVFNEVKDCDRQNSLCKAPSRNSSRYPGRLHATAGANDQHALHIQSHCRKPGSSTLMWFIPAALPSHLPQVEAPRRMFVPVLSDILSCSNAR